MTRHDSELSGKLDTEAGKAAIELIIRTLEEQLKEEPRRAFAYGWASLILVPYALHVIEDAHRRQLECLYICAGDGYEFKQICDTLIRRRKYNLRTRYLYGSAKAWKPVSAKKTKKETAQRKLAVRYLKENVDFSERFAIVGYYENAETSRNLHTAMEEAIKHGVAYRSYWMYPHQGDSASSADYFTERPYQALRRATEVLNANQPVKKVTSYEEHGKRVRPVFSFRKNAPDLDHALRQELMRFADTVPLPDKEESDLFCHELYALAAGYYETNQDAPIFLETLATLPVTRKDGSTREFAPPITSADLRKRLLNHTYFATDSLPMSIARSSSAVARLYKIYRKKSETGTEGQVL